jgi:hypothetical protein
MADNIAVTPGTGATVGADDVGGGVLIQRVKATFGVDGTATDVSSTNPLPATQGPASITTTTLQSAAAATGNGTAQTVTGHAQAVINVTGTFVGTLTFEGSPDGGTTYIALLAQTVGSTATPASTTTTTGSFIVSTAGLSNLRARVSAYTSGSITAISYATPVPAINQVAAVNPATLIAGEDLTNNIMKVNQVFSNTYISTATTTTVKTGAGLLHTIVVNGGTTGTCIIYDNTAASGTILASFDTTNALATYTFDCSFSTGLTLITSAATKISVNWR